MAAIFPRTLRSVENEGLAWWLVVAGGGLIVLGLIAMWLLRADVPRRQVAPGAAIVERGAAASRVGRTRPIALLRGSDGRVAASDVP